MTKKYYVFAVALLISIAGALYATFSRQIAQPIANEVTTLDDSRESLPQIKLSEDANFPSPVIQLQQTITHGLIEAERVDLPLLSGELAEFSQKNISEEYPSPPELENLKQRLKKLQSLNQ
ncbi:hypothetical protein TW78_08825 [Vibrio coralliilyticus]|uniref:Uncharacterized protein n=1 Tax=Vibrio coralliilyticus TaxID=190893 RepID=A0A837G8Y3_9VIBR|nr:hypothetical protein [Vibrio coralliilyticus]KJY74128.1 hypothetical protein TW78_08825 [Vibrio coralliilyticus]QOU29872.1 hypothetical protein TW71_015095 [Vibrio coralliilyticus]